MSAKENFKGEKMKILLAKLIDSAIVEAIKNISIEIRYEQEAGNIRVVNEDDLNEATTECMVYLHKNYGINNTNLYDNIVDSIEETIQDIIRGGDY